MPLNGAEKGPLPCDCALKNMAYGVKPSFTDPRRPSQCTCPASPKAHVHAWCIKHRAKRIVDVED